MNRKTRKSGNQSVSGAVEGAEGAGKDKNVEAKTTGLTVQLEKISLKRTGKCIPKSAEVPAYEITSSKIRQYIQRMQDYVVIGKFMGIWPSEKALEWWIQIH
jgi:hypothetical protein